MLHRNTNFNRRLAVGMLRLPPKASLLVLAFFSIAFCSLCSNLLCGNDSYAASCEDGTVPCVEVSFGTPQGGSLSVQPGISYYDSTQFYLPVEISLMNTSAYTVKVYGSGSSLTSGSDIIPTIGTDTAYTDLGKNGSEWGIRWNLGDIVNDKDTSYHKIPASSDDGDSVVVENQSLPKSSTAVKKQLTLGFAVAVDANQPSGSYTNTVTVAVVASPRDARSFFDITNMQEMTPEICANTTTPAKTATTKFDTDGSYPEDTSYVPQTTLTDTRDGKEYLVRKLADGNCWMSQNLSLMLSTNTSLMSDTTDLNSKSEWTPTNNTQTAAGTKWNNSDGVDRSCSAGWDQYYNGTVQDYAQYGVRYNWFAAVAGSGKRTDVAATTDDNRIINGIVQDSICPKGWTLPVGGTTAVNIVNGSVKSFYNLVQLYTGTTGNFSGDNKILYVAPMNFVPAGDYDNPTGTLNLVGITQLYWSGTAFTDTAAAWALGLDLNIIHPGMLGGYRGNGFSIRCVAR